MRKSREYSGTLNAASGGGIGFGTVLFLIFLVLKLTNLIDWSWWWVTSPLWIPFAIVLSICLICFLVGFIIGTLRLIFKKKRGDLHNGN